MVRRAFSAATLFLLALSAVSTAAPIRLARQPDYHAGKVAFSYLGDIWVANEDGSNVLRLTDSRGHEMNPRFSPDGRWIAFSSNRYGNNDVFVVAATGGTPRRLTFHTGNDEVVGWTRDSQHVLFRAAHGDGAFPNVATLYQVPVNGGREQALPVDWGYWGSFSPDGKSLVFNRHPAVWTRQHYRGSYAADSITPVANTAFGDLQYARWVDERREMVTKASNGDIGYLHIRAMDAPSLRQFQLDLAANRTKKALIIDQRFNGGGGIDQELLGILAGRQYQYTINRDTGFQQPRPLNFYGPMVVMENERSASDAEMFPAGFKALGLGKVVGVPSMGAVIGTGAYTLLDGSTIRTPGSGVWTVTSQNMENFGVPPDVFVDNLPGDFIKGRDMQIEKAVEVLKADLASKKPTTQQP